jgi:hypothetical protein
LGGSPFPSSTRLDNHKNLGGGPFQRSPVTVALVILVTTPHLGAIDMKSQPTATPLKWLINDPIWVDPWSP